jgi:hypothetical protein
VQYNQLLQNTHKLHVKCDVPVYVSFVPLPQFAATSWETMAVLCLYTIIPYRIPECFNQSDDTKGKIIKGKSL